MNLFFIYGEEPYFIEQKKTELLKQFIKSDSDKFNLERFGATNFDIKRLKSSIMSMPMMSDYRVVQITELQKSMKGKIAKATKHARDSIIDNVPDFTIIIIDANLDNKKLSVYPWKDLIKKCQSFHFPLLRYEKVDTAIGEIAKSKKIQLDAEIVQYLKNRYEGDFQAIDLELDKLMNFAPDTKNFSFEAASELLNLDKKYNLNELTRNLEAKHKAGILEIVLGLLEVGVALPFILATMKNFYISLYKYYEASRRFSQKNDIARNTGVPPFFLNGIANASRKYTQDEVESLLESLLWCEYRLKSQSTNHSNLFIDTVAVAFSK